MNRITNRLYILIFMLYISIDIYAQISENNNIEADTLKEVIITASNVKHKVNEDEYFITERMKQKSGGNILGLIATIPGIQLNKLNNTLSINNKNNILLLINDKPYSIEYIKNIDPQNVVRIIVNKNPKGRYTSTEYDAIINVKLRDLKGLNINISNFLILNPNNNSGDIVMMEQPGGSFTFSKNKISLYGSYVYGNSHWNTPFNENLNYLDIKNAHKNGMDHYKYIGNAGNIGINYNITPNHSLSFEVDVRHENTSNKRNSSSNETSINQSVYTQSKSPIVGSTVFYKGIFKEKFDVYSELNFNTLNNNNKNYLLSNIEQYNFSTLFKESRHELKYTTDFTLHFTQGLSLNWGYQLNHKKYSSDSFLYRNTKNKLWAYLNISTNKNFELSIGTALNHEYMEGDKYTNILPALNIQYSPSSSINFNFSYISNSQTPTLSMLNPALTALNLNVYQKGNPNLKNCITHKLEFSTNLFNMITISPFYSYNHNQIINYASETDNKITFQYKNASLKEASIPISANYSINDMFHFNIMGAYYISKGKHAKYTRTVDGWWYSGNMTFTKNEYMVDLGYSHNIIKNNTVQGYTQNGVDCWTLTANKQWFNGSLTTSITWLMPLKWGITENLSTIKSTSFYQENTQTSLKPYKNALILQIIYRFNSGKAKKTTKRYNTENEKRIFGGFNL